MIRVTSSGGFNNTERFLKSAQKMDIGSVLERYAQKGVSALKNATPMETGQAASSWNYKVTKIRSGWSIVWTNSDLVDGIPLVILLQYGHGTGNGGYVEGRDFINPALRPIFDQIANEAWKAVKSA